LVLDGTPAPSTPSRLVKKKRQSLMRGGTGIRKWAAQHDWLKIFVSQDLIG